jgi:hypothetical protein
MTPQEEVREAYASFANAYRVYEMKVGKGYRFNGDLDCDLVQDTWNKYLRLRKQHGDYR